MVRIGILGCARIAKVAMIDAAPFVPGLEIAAVASRDGAKAAAFAAEHGITASHDSYGAMLADPALDAVYIPLPNALHADWAIAALDAGKAVLCEKPLASNAADARRMAEAACSNGLPLMEAVHYRFHPLARFVDDLLAAGRLGRIEAVEAGFEIPGKFVSADDIRFDARLAGGAMMDVGSYCLGALRWVTGEEPIVLSAEADLAGPEIDRGMQVEFGFGSGAKGRVQASLAAPRLRAWLTIRGTDATLHIDNPFLPHLGNSLTLEEAGTAKTMSFDRTPTYVFQAAAFSRVVCGTEPPLIKLADSIATMEGIDAVYRAAGLSPRG